MRSRFDEQLNDLNKQLIEMGALCEEIISMAAEALFDNDSMIVKEVAPLEGEIDRMERTIESLCLKLLLQQQPVAKDLRQISSVLKIITDMERIGDQALDIAEIITFINRQSINEYKFINDMAKEACTMVTKSIDAFVKQDMTLANEVITEDDIVDNLFKQVKQSLIEIIAENPDEGENVIDYIMIAKYFERIADHATNIAEWVVFSITGIHKEEINT